MSEKVHMDQKAFVVAPELGDPTVIMSTMELLTEMGDVGSTKLGDLGLDLPSDLGPGMYVWEGVVSSTDETITFSHGAWRPPLFDEVAAVVGGFSFWTLDDDDVDESETEGD